MSVDVPGQHRVPAPVKPLAGRLIEVGPGPIAVILPPSTRTTWGPGSPPSPSAVDQAPAADSRTGVESLSIASTTPIPIPRPPTWHCKGRHYHGAANLLPHECRVSTVDSFQCPTRLNLTTKHANAEG